MDQGTFATTKNHVRSSRYFPLLKVRADRLLCRGRVRGVFLRGDTIFKIILLGCLILEWREEEVFFPL